ncbi:MAG: energy-coupling factor ABC transporter permease [Rhodocyclaceae bacterium]|nr:energy-coupling factor ABC transporter permease [Rhodocyclaceae bacterium]
MFPSAWLWLSACVASVVVAGAAYRAPWRRLRDSVRFNAWLGAIVVLMLLWALNAGVREGLNLHLLGAGVATLMFGAPLALIALAVVIVASAINGSIQWSALGLNLLIMGAIPVLLATRVRQLAERYLPANYFIYIFVQAFAGSGVGVFLVGIAATTVLTLAGAYPSELLLEEYLPFFLLLASSEAWMSGMAMTLMVVFRPAWVESFDDKRYLNDSPGPPPGRNRDNTGEKGNE